MSDLPFFHDLSPNVIATLLAGTATLVAALINLRLAWRRQVLDRLQKPRNGNGKGGKPGRGMLITIIVLLIAAGIIGYAGALYVMQNDWQNTWTLRNDLQQRIVQLQAAASRMEQTRIEERAAIDAEAKLREERLRGGNGVAATTRIGPCRPRGGGAAACIETDSTQLSVCASIPVSATVFEATPFVRAENDSTGWSEHRLVLGDQSGGVRVGKQFIERPESDTTKQICVDFQSLNTQHAVDARLLVKYVPAEQPVPSAPSPAPMRASAEVKTEVKAASGEAAKSPAK